MTKEVEITVENRMVLEKRTLSIYHKGGDSTHLINNGSYHTLPLETAAEDDYLHISPGKGPGELKNECVLSIPSWTEFEFSSENKIGLTHRAKRFLLTVPAGTAGWDLRLTRPIDSETSPPKDTVTVRDDELLNAGHPWQKKPQVSEGNLKNF